MVHNNKSKSTAIRAEQREICDEYVVLKNYYYSSAPRWYLWGWGDIESVALMKDQQDHKCRSQVI